ncbi:MAG: hypothetical protein JWO95_3441 [Verrucomicrobiales bacterium]|nr:hypothetical protein [Verrucomicrobiales bacterium]
MMGIAATAALLVSCSSDQTTTKVPTNKKTKAPAAHVDNVETVLVGQNVTLQTKMPGGVQFQWLKNGTPIPGATDKTLTLTDVQPADGGFFAADYKNSGNKSFMSPTTTVQVMATNLSVLTIYAPPQAIIGGSGTGCPGMYVGLVNYTKTIANGWGWKPDTNTTTHTACDPYMNGTKVEYLGKSADRLCDTNCVTITSNPPTSTAYRFTIYFPTGPVPTTNYPIQLPGFLP